MRKSTVPKQIVLMRAPKFRALLKGMPVLVLAGVFVATQPGCGTADPFARGEATPTPTPTPTLTPSPTPGITPTPGTPGVTDTPGTEVTPTPSAPTPVPKSFADDVKPLLSICTGCHASGPGATSWTYDAGSNAYGQVMLKVTVTDPASSLLLTKASGSTSHEGGTFYPTSSSGYKTMLAWIEAGAPDN